MGTRTLPSKSQHLSHRVPVKSHAFPQPSPDPPENLTRSNCLSHTPTRNAIAFPRRPREGETRAIGHGSTHRAVAPVFALSLEPCPFVRALPYRSSPPFPRATTPHEGRLIPRRANVVPGPLPRDSTAKGQLHLSDQLDHSRPGQSL